MTQRPRRKQRSKVCATGKGNNNCTPEEKGGGIARYKGLSLDNSKYTS